MIYFVTVVGVVDVNAINRCTLEANEFSSFIIIIEINLHRLIASITLRCLLFNEQKKLREKHKLSQSTDLGVCELEHSTCEEV